MNYYKFLIVLFLSLFLSCSDNQIIKWENYDENIEIIENSTHEISRMRYKRIQSLSSDKNDIFKPFYSFLKSYDKSHHENLKKLILTGGDDYEILFTGPNGLDKKKNITKIGKITKEKKINIVDFDDRINLDGYKHEI